MLLYCLLTLFTQANPDDKAAEKAAAAAVEAFEKAYKGNEADKVAAIAELTTIQHVKTANRLASLLSSSDSMKVRYAAISALGKFSEQRKGAGSLLANALTAATKDPGLYGAICSALEDLKEPSTVYTLTRYFQDKDIALARRTMEAAGKIGSSAAIDPLIAVVVHSEKIIRNAAGAAALGSTDPGTGRTFVAGPELRPAQRARIALTAAHLALREITNEPITTADGWSAWWSRNKDSFEKK